MYGICRFTIHREYSSQIIPLFYALLMGKKFKDHDDLFKTLTSKTNLYPNTVSLDYEQTALIPLRNSFLIQFDTLDFCFGSLYDVGQSVGRHV